MSYGIENERFLAAAGLPGDLLGTPRVAVELTSQGAEVQGGPAAFMLAAIILCRLFRHVRLLGPDVLIGPNPWGLARLSDLVDPLSELCEGRVDWQGRGPVDGVLGIGGPPKTGATHSTFVTFSGWRFGIDTEVLGRPAGTVLGALAGACYGTSQLFLRLGAAAGASCRPIRPFTFSLRTYSAADPSQDVLGDIVFERDHLVGVGAVGCAAVYALGHHQNLLGQIVAVDNDLFDGSNLQRYVLMRRSDDGRAKVEVAREVLERSGLQVVPVGKRFDEYFQVQRPRIPLLLTPIDSEDGRRRLAGYLSRRVLNVATGGSTVTVSRHGFGDGKMCLACLYPPARGETDWQVVAAKTLGLSIAEMEHHLETNQPVSSELLRRVEKHRQLEPMALAQFEGKAIQTLYRGGVCGAAGITTPGGTVVAPLAFISALGGVVLAAEWIKERAPALASRRLANYFRFDLFAAPNPDMLQERVPRSGCICGDEDYKVTFMKRWIQSDDRGF